MIAREDCGCILTFNDGIAEVYVECPECRLESKLCKEEHPDIDFYGVVEKDDDYDENVVVPPENMAQEVNFETDEPISHEEFYGDEIEGGKIHHPNHYNEGIEAWDYIISHNMNFLEGNIVKYITRYKHKNGLEDLKKVRQYLDKLIETEYGNV